MTDLDPRGSESKISNKRGKMLRAIGWAATIACLPLGLAVAREIKRGNKLRAVALSTAYMGLDVANGVIYRKGGSETIARRTADAAIDGVTVLSALSALQKRNVTARPYAKLLISKEVVRTAAIGYNFLKTGQAMRGDKAQKLAPISVAAFVTSSLSDNSTATHISGLVASGLNIMLAADNVEAALRPGGEVENDVCKVEGFHLVRSIIQSISQKRRRA